MSANVRIIGLDEAIAELAAAFDVDLREGLLRGAQAVADEAAASHPYENRTGALQAATQAGAVRGMASDGEVSAEVVGDTEYGGFVEGNPTFAFLAPAVEHSEGRIEEEIEAALERAAQHAGWT